LTDLSDNCVLALDDNVSSNYADDMFSNADSYPTLSHMLSPSATQSSPSMQQPPSTVPCQATSNCHISVASSQHQPPTISTQQRQNLHTLGNAVPFNIIYFPILVVGLTLSSQQLCPDASNLGVWELTTLFKCEIFFSKQRWRKRIFHT